MKNILQRLGFGRREVRSSGGGFEAAVLSAFESGASGSGTVRASATAALEIASSTIARAFAAWRPSRGLRS